VDRARDDEGRWRLPGDPVPLLYSEQSSASKAMRPGCETKTAWCDPVPTTYSNFDGATDLEFRLATDALELEKSGLSYQSVPPTNRWSASVAR